MDVLQTRGLLALKLPRTIEQDEFAFRWYTDPPTQRVVISFGILMAQ